MERVAVREDALPKNIRGFRFGWTGEDKNIGYINETTSVYHGETE